MKRIICCLFIIVISTSSFSQCLYNKYENHSKSLKLNGKVKFLKELTYRSVKDKNAEERKELDYTIYYKFNEKGNLIEKKQLRADGSLAANYTYSYDAKGQMTQEKFENGNKDGGYISVCFCDDKKNELNSKSIFKGGQVLVTLKRKFNKKGKIIEQTYNDLYSKRVQITHSEYSANGRVLTSWGKDDKTKMVYEFDTDSNLIKMMFYDEKQNVTSTVAYEYDQFNNEIKRVSNDLNDGYTSETKINYIYDSSNNWIRKVSNNVILTREIEYY